MRWDMDGKEPFWDVLQFCLVFRRRLCFGSMAQGLGIVVHFVRVIRWTSKDGDV
jgi:hypothetical protein